MRHFALILLLLPALARPASAALVAVDLFAAGDGLVTRDTDSGLDWLDLPLTTSLSYDQIQAGAGNWLAAGWRYATEAEVCHLWVTHGEAPSCNSNTPGILQPDAAQALMTLLGTTENVSAGGGFVTVRVNGLYDDATAPATSVGLGRIEVSTVFGSGIFGRATSVAPNAIASNAFLNTRGSFLVRATPPVIPALSPHAFAALAALLAFAARAQLRTRGVR
jgi:hypothetical protein